MPKNGGANDAVDNGSNDRRNSIYGINPANGGASNAPESADENDDQDAAGDADQMSRPRSRSTAGQGTRNPGRPGADPAPGSHGPDSQQLDAAVRSRQAGTPGTGGANQRHPPAMVRAPGRTDHPHRTAGQRAAGRHHALIDDRRHQGLRPLAPAGVGRGDAVGASAVENRGHEHVHTVLQEPVRLQGNHRVGRPRCSPPSGPPPGQLRRL